MVSPSSRRRAVTYVVGQGLGSAAQSCRALGLARSSFCRRSRVSPERAVMKQRIIALSEAHPRYGYRRIGALLRREGQRVNPKRVQRIRRQEGLEVRKNQRATRRIGISTATRQRAQRANQVWSWDIIYDQTEAGSTLRILTLIDEYTQAVFGHRSGPIHSSAGCNQSLGRSDRTLRSA